MEADQRFARVAQDPRFKASFVISCYIWVTLSSVFMCISKTLTYVFLPYLYWVRLPFQMQSLKVIRSMSTVVCVYIHKLNVQSWTTRSTVGSSCRENKLSLICITCLWCFVIFRKSRERSGNSRSMDDFRRCLQTRILPQNVSFHLCTCIIQSRAK